MLRSRSWSFGKVAVGLFASDSATLILSKYLISFHDRLLWRKPVKSTGTDYTNFSRNYLCYLTASLNLHFHVRRRLSLQYLSNYSGRQSCLRVCKVGTPCSLQVLVALASACCIMIQCYYFKISGIISEKKLAQSPLNYKTMIQAYWRHTDCAGNTDETCFWFRRHLELGSVVRFP